MMACRVYNHRYRVDKEAAPPDEDNIGGYPAEWEPVPGLAGYCDIQPIRGREILQGAKLQGEVTHKIYIPFNPAAERIDASMRLVHGTRVFNIRYAIVIKERQQEWEVMADEGVAV